MSFRWIYHDAEGRDAGASEQFGSKQEAEDFMGRDWQALLESRVLAATLMDADQRLYRMKLTED